MPRYKFDNSIHSHNDSCISIHGHYAKLEVSVAALRVYQLVRGKNGTWNKEQRTEHIQERSAERARN